jgi:hypothetical protein
VAPCTTAADCVPESWCHPMSCVPDGLQVDVGACDTGGCRFGEIGCGSECACEEGLCVAVPSDWGF